MLHSADSDREATDGGKRPAPPHNEIDVVVQRAAEAEALLASAEFRDAWRALYEGCPWATVFQSPEYTEAGFSATAEFVEPVLVTGRAPDGTLKGVLALGFDRELRRLMPGFAGDEYKAWIAAPEYGAGFAASAIAKLRSAFPGQTIDLLCLPPGTPLGWLETPGGRLCSAVIVPWPLADTVSSKASESLRRKAHKLNRMSRQGEIRFEVMDDPSQVSAALNSILPAFRLRQAALSGAMPWDERHEFEAWLSGARALLPMRTPRRKET